MEGCEMTCVFCKQEARELQMHHPRPRNEGGKKTVPACRSCHVEHHSSNNDYREWGRKGGRISALDKHWAHTLKNVKDDPLYEQARGFYDANYRGGKPARRGGKRREH
jgi:hypothetical protein